MSSSAPSDFDVGPRGISGHYDAMMGGLRQATPRVVLALAAWAWVLTWPSDGRFMAIGPVLTLAFVLKLALLAWTVWAALPLPMAFWHWSKWRALESAGLKTMVRNDHRLRIIAFSRETGRYSLDQTTQAQRMEQTRSVVHNRRARIATAWKRLLVGLAYLIAVPAVCILLPRLTGHHLRFLTAPIHFSSLPDDADSVLNPLSLEGIALWLVFFVVVVPRLSELFWLAYDGHVHESGSQYVPGAKVLEPYIDEPTLDTMRGQNVHGSTAKGPLGEAGRRMSS
jgi:hypothetical protein